MVEDKSDSEFGKEDLQEVLEGVRFLGRGLARSAEIMGPLMTRVVKAAKDPISSTVKLKQNLDAVRQEGLVEWANRLREHGGLDENGAAQLIALEMQLQHHDWDGVFKECVRVLGQWAPVGAALIQGALARLGVMFDIDDYLGDEEIPDGH